MTGGKLPPDMIETALDDFRAVHQLVSPTPLEAMVVAHIEWMNDRWRFEYGPEPSNKTASRFLLEYTVIERNGWTCRIAVVQQVAEPLAAAPAPELLRQFGQLKDLKGLDLTGGSPQGTSNLSATRLLLDGIFLVGFNAARVAVPSPVH